MEKFIKRTVSALLFLSCLLLSACSIKQDRDTHRHSVLPGSEYCETCGEKISICPECQMVNSETDETCWFCHAALK